MRIISLIAATAVMTVAIPAAPAAAAPHHGWHRVCTWHGHGHHRHQVCRRSHW